MEAFASLPINWRIVPFMVTDTIYYGGRYWSNVNIHLASNENMKYLKVCSYNLSTSLAINTLTRREGKDQNPGKSNQSPLQIAGGAVIRERGS